VRQLRIVDDLPRDGGDYVLMPFDAQWPTCAIGRGAESPVAGRHAAVERMGRILMAEQLPVGVLVVVRS
jgi:hypothetical protein